MENLVDQFLHHIKVERGYAVNTLNAYQRDLLQFIKFSRKQGLNNWRALTSDILGDYLKSLQQNQYRSSTVSRKVATVRSFLNFLFAEGIVSNDLLNWIHQPKTGKRLPKTLTQAEVIQLLHTTTPSPLP